VRLALPCLVLSNLLHAHADAVISQRYTEEFYAYGFPEFGGDFVAVGNLSQARA
jgi:hypothetical protein